MRYEITPPKGLVNINLSEIWRYRDLLYILVWRDIKVRYKQTVVGVVWAIFQPLLTMIIFSVLFGRLAKLPSEGVPYPVFVYTGLLLWNYFSSSLANSSESLISNDAIIKKVYFPRILLPGSTVVTPAVDFVISFIIFLALMFYYHFTPSAVGLLLIPVLLLITMISSLGLGLFLSSLNIKYRDVRHILPFFIQILMYITPVIYPVSIIPANFQWIAYLNPMSGVITLARSLLLHTSSVDW
ncbi:phosphate ABC transporter permease, partial [Candidatus Berkelbacteria bacterium CG10_big_fil_rev_8_21_14_0_10_41_12]